MTRRNRIADRLTLAALFAILMVVPVGALTARVPDAPVRAAIGSAYLVLLLAIALAQTVANYRARREESETHRP